MRPIPWEGAPWTPRAWQAEALPIVIEAIKRGERAIVAAIMGSGKSILQTEIAWLAMHRRGDRAIVFTAPRQALVRQLAGTLRARLGQLEVGEYYADRKQPHRPVIVTCAASLASLRDELAKQGRAVALAIVDEAHGSEARQVREILPLLEPRCLVGFTATPFRSLPSESISLFSSVAYRYTMADALRDRVLVPMRHVRYEGTRPGSVDDECLRLIQEHAHGPGIVSAASIPDAKEHATWLAAAGLPAMAIHSKISTTERGRLLEGLRRGDPMALVHVSLLAEGVDLPWLRWLCLRRRVGARVRFLQEIGRVLRVLDAGKFPGSVERWGPKEEGLVFDPHLLLGRHGLTSAEAIGRAMEEAAEAMTRDKEAEAREAKEAEVIALDRLLEYLTEVRAMLLDAEIVRKREFEGGGWRMVKVSEKQVQAIKQASRLTRHIPAQYRDPIRALIKVPWALTRGDAADLLDVLWGGSRWAKSAASRCSRPAHRLQWSRRHLVGLNTPSADDTRTVRLMKR